jgi:hypothetical protein
MDYKSLIFEARGLLALLSRIDVAKGWVFTAAEGSRAR